MVLAYTPEELDLLKTTHTRTTSYISDTSLNIDFFLNTSHLSPISRPIIVQYVTPQKSLIGVSVYSWLLGPNITFAQQVLQSEAHALKISTRAMSFWPSYDHLGVNYGFGVESSYSYMLKRSFLVGAALGSDYTNHDSGFSIKRDIHGYLELEMAMHLSEDSSMVLGFNYAKKYKSSDLVFYKEKDDTVGTELESESSKEANNRWIESNYGLYQWGAGLSLLFFRVWSVDILKFGFNYLFKDQESSVLLGIDF